MNINSHDSLQADADLVSVIVPVYNVKNYLSQCIYSLLNQTYRNIEIILIDDGSTDGSFHICKEYANSDSRVRLYRKKNGGLSSARNYGFSKAEGSWLMYVDSDDALAPGAVERLMGAIQDTNSEVAICDFLCFSDENKLRFSTASSSKTIASPQESLELLYTEHSSGCAAWGKLARIDLWGNVKFPEGRKFEDFSCIHGLILNAQSVCFVEEPLYYYRKRPGSITSSFSAEASKDLMTSILELQEVSGSFMGPLRSSALFKCSLEATRMCARVEDLDSKDAKKAVDFLRKNTIEALQARNRPFLQTVRIILVALFPRFGSFLSRLFLR